MTPDGQGQPICRLCGEFREGPHCCITVQKARIAALDLAKRQRLAETCVALDVAAHNFSDAPALHAAALNFAAALLCVEGEAWHAETAHLLWKLAERAKNPVKEARSDKQVTVMGSFTHVDQVRALLWAARTQISRRIVLADTEGTVRLSIESVEWLCAIAIATIGGETNDAVCSCDQRGDYCATHPTCACGCQRHAHQINGPCIAGKLSCHGCEGYQPAKLNRFHELDAEALEHATIDDLRRAYKDLRAHHVEETTALWTKLSDR